MNAIEKLSKSEEEAIRQIARSEAETVLSETTTDNSGDNWSIRRFVNQFKITRRQAIGAMGLLMVGEAASPVEAALKSVSGTAQAQSTGGLTVPGDLNVGGAVSTDAATIGGVGADRQWEHDGTINASGDPVSYSLNLSYDEVLVIFRSVSTSGDDFRMRLNNDSNAFYNLLYDDGTPSTGASEWTIASGTGGAGWMKFNRTDGWTANRIVGTVEMSNVGGYTPFAQRIWTDASGSTPVNSIQFSRNTANPIDIDAEVYQAKTNP